ncbi:uncharacterized protein BT62DRAFT_797537 [Guyanagaster necrorhizus]|uniref:Uncharacterized protein n=1 Tax=Guyanagaster necrorhizus TaxID=856835 RepID=A0A9P8ALT3_9AGAR|nr:uncharacterized protein BT62DRAFT_797537 [Guyanagaster necrorhizus MCA 3950]KAG7439162.1 hypothetical protein BT62DRAFT_797537 [Guyanagaster necrorhizus MCA 3950]
MKLVAELRILKEERNLANVTADHCYREQDPPPQPSASPKLPLPLFGLIRACHGLIACGVLAHCLQLFGADNRTPSCDTILLSRVPRRRMTILSCFEGVGTILLLMYTDSIFIPRF